MLALLAPQLRPPNDKLIENEKFSEESEDEDVLQHIETGLDAYHDPVEANLVKRSDYCRYFDPYEYETPQAKQLNKTQCLKAYEFFYEERVDEGKLMQQVQYDADHENIYGHANGEDLRAKIEKQGTQAVEDHLRMLESKRHRGDHSVFW